MQEKIGRISETVLRGFRLPTDFSILEADKINSILKSGKSPSDDRLEFEGEVVLAKFKGEVFFVTGSETTKKLLEEELFLDGIKTVHFPLKKNVKKIKEWPI